MSVEYRFDLDTNTKVTRIDLDYTSARAANLDNLDSSISSRSSQVSVDNLQATANNIESAVTIIDGNVDSIKATVDSNLDQAISATESNIRGASNRDITEVYDLVNGTSNPFRLTTFKTVSGASTAYVASTWVDIYDSGILTKDTEIAGIQIDNTVGSPVSPVFRITLSDGTTKIFPFGASNDVKSGKLKEIENLIRVPAGQGFKIQVNCTQANSASATLVELDIIEHG